MAGRRHRTQPLSESVISCCGSQLSPNGQQVLNRRHLRHLQISRCNLQSQQLAVYVLDVMSDDTALLSPAARHPGQQSARVSNAERTLRSLCSVDVATYRPTLPRHPADCTDASAAQAMGSDLCPRGPTPRSLCWSQTWRLRCVPSTRRSCSSARGLATPCSSLARLASSVEVGAEFVPQAYERTDVSAPVACFQHTRCGGPSSAPPCRACTCTQCVAA